jgi:pyruvate formate lyase activating enzyme
MQEALFYTKEPEGNVRCLLCPHHCLITEGRTGVCHVRKNISGKLVTLVFGNLAAIHTDPIEKKPLYHFHPGSRILSIGTAGCNLHCSFCQNWHLSQGEPESPGEKSPLSPESLVAQSAEIPGNIGIAYTYNEPAVFYEYMTCVSRLAKIAGLKNVVVSNGFIDQEPLEKILPDIDAFNIDLKSFNDDFYRRITGGKLEPVLDSLKSIVHAGKHLEITFLLIPELNASQDEFREMVSWIASELGSHIPLHISRYFPAWKLKNPPTPVSMMETFTAIAGEKLNWVYPGNVSGSRDSSSWCPGCGALLIRREQYYTVIVNLDREGKCNRCGLNIPVILNNT